MPTLISEDEIDRHIGNKVRVRRKLSRMTQTQLGEALGVSFQQVQKYERGTNRISGSALYVIAKFFGVPVAYFYEGLPVTVSGVSVQATERERGIEEYLHTRDGVEMVEALKLLPTQFHRPVLDHIRSIGEAASA